MTFYVPTPQLSDTVRSPLGLWYFNGNGNDSSGNAKNLTPTGAIQYSASPYPATAAWYNITSRFTIADSSFRLTGAVTVMGMLALRAIPSSDQIFLFLGVSGDETQSGNVLYSLRVQADGHLQYLHEHDAGVNQTVTTTNPYMVPGAWHHCALTRDSAGTRIKIFLNGTKVREATVSTAPNGGSSSVLSFGATDNGGAPFEGLLSNWQILSSGLSEDQIRAEAGRAMGVFT